MKIMGLDLGSKTVGIAISDIFGQLAQPIETFQFKTNHYKHALTYVMALSQKENVTKIVLGLPLNMDSTESERSLVSRRFAKKLEEAIDIPIILWDERLSSLQVERILIEGGVRRQNRKDHIDKLAATVILQSYLDSPNKEM